mmetsp:Transcript_95304/g.308717  ORF Transcript_95304/g.308717 Transcript_95304/m.308717 type:complete len:246 (-) Transcript_95304:122-859(-)
MDENPPRCCTNCLFPLCEVFAPDPIQGQRQRWLRRAARSVDGCWVFTHCRQVQHHSCQDDSKRPASLFALNEYVCGKTAVVRVVLVQHFGLRPVKKLQCVADAGRQANQRGERSHEVLIFAALLREKERPGHPSDLRDLHHSSDAGHHRRHPRTRTTQDDIYLRSIKLLAHLLSELRVTSRLARHVLDRDRVVQMPHRNQGLRRPLYLVEDQIGERQERGDLEPITDANRQVHGTRRIHCHQHCQ